MKQLMFSRTGAIVFPVRLIKDRLYACLTMENTYQAHTIPLDTPLSAKFELRFPTILNVSFTLKSGNNYLTQSYLLDVADVPVFIDYLMNNVTAVFEALPCEAFIIPKGHYNCMRLPVLCTGEAISHVGL